MRLCCVQQFLIVALSGGSSLSSVAVGMPASGGRGGCTNELVLAKARSLQPLGHPHGQYLPQVRDFCMSHNNVIDMLCQLYVYGLFPASQSLKTQGLLLHTS
jgi:hypothetical protein